MSNKGVLQQANERLTQVAHTVSGVNYTGSDFQWPAFDDLPKVNAQPQGCIWGVFDTDGKRDEVGTVNLLTPTLVKSAAATEIRKGEHIQLDWSLENVQFPGFGRKPFAQTVIDLDKLGFKAMDDEIYINTQSGSQWDSLRHFAHQASGMYYNGLAHADAVNNTRNGIHNWVERGGIVGRGILVDWVRWYEHKHGKPPPSPVTRHEIPLSEIKETIEYQGLKPLPGDIAIFRSGYVRWHDAANADDRKAGTQAASNAIGLVQNEEMVRWLYDQHFSAVVGDTVAFEAWPPPIEKGWCLHEWLLVQWGTPIGEMWNLEDLSKKCEEENRWTFFLTSAPLHYKGCVGSPPGAIAIF